MLPEWNDTLDMEAYRRCRYYFLRGYQAGLLDFPNWDWEDG